MHEQRIQVIFDCGILNDIWFDPKEAAVMTDDEIIEVLQEDLIALIKSTTYKIVRHNADDA